MLDKHSPQPAAALRGLHRGELAGLRWTDVDLHAAELTVTQQRVHANAQVVVGPPKSAASCRAVALDAETVRVLIWHRERQDELSATAGTRWQTRDTCSPPWGAPLRAEASVALVPRAVGVSETGGLPPVSPIRPGWPIGFQVRAEPQVKASLMARPAGFEPATVGLEARSFSATPCRSDGDSGRLPRTLHARQCRVLTTRVGAYEHAPSTPATSCRPRRGHHLPHLVGIDSLYCSLHRPRICRSNCMNGAFGPVVRRVGCISFIVETGPPLR